MADETAQIVKVSLCGLTLAQIAITPLGDELGDVHSAVHSPCFIRLL
jgi:hypothetical protein